MSLFFGFVTLFLSIVCVCLCLFLCLRLCVFVCGCVCVPTNAEESPGDRPRGTQGAQKAAREINNLAQDDPHGFYCKHMQTCKRGGGYLRARQVGGDAGAQHWILYAACWTMQTSQRSVRSPPYGAPKGP